MSPRGRLALIGALGHAPGLWLFARVKLTPPVARQNIWAAGATVAAMVAAGVVAPEGDGPAWVFVAWLVGHCAWSALLARAALAGALDAPSQVETAEAP